MTPRRRWGAETLVGVAVALFFTPIWRYGSDAGWIGCEYKPRGATLDGLGWPANCGVTLGG